MSQLKLYLFGNPRVEVNGALVDLSRRKVMAMLAYLAMTRQSQRRDALVGLLWPESGQQQARSSLRRELHGLIRLIGEGWLATTRETIEINPDANVWVDVEEFRQLATNAEQEDNATVDALSRAIELYQGDFLAGFTLSDCPDFDDWQFFETDALRREAAAILERLVAHYESLGTFEQAIVYARKWLSHDMMHEPVHRKLMRLFALAGQQAAAIRQYDECVRIMDEELGVPPEDETTELFEAIRTRKFVTGEMNAAAENRDALIANDQSSAPTDHPPKQNLPAQPTSFIGREDDLDAIRKLLIEEADCRLLTLIGPGGIGKTRLAIEAGAQLLDDYPDGVYLVSLVSVADVENIFTSIAEAMGFTLQGGDEPSTQLCHFFGTRKALLILDNFEHLLDGAIDLAGLLKAAPNVILLVTTREALGLQEEWLYPVVGMELPADTDELSTAQTTASIKLFVERAKQVDAAFTITDETKPHLVRICQAVEGMPLGLELAASWLRALPCPEIADEIERNLDLLSTTVRNVPERHRSVRVIFEQTWNQLTKEERNVLSALSIFRGGCTRDAATKVVGTSLPLIMQLVDKSLLQRTAKGRYQMHELFRQYAFEHLHSSPEIQQQLLDEFSDYFTTYLHGCQTDLEGGRQQQALQSIVADIDNIRLAWETAVNRGNLAALKRSAESLCIFTDMHGSYLDGITMFQHAIDALTEQMTTIDLDPPGHVAGEHVAGEHGARGNNVMESNVEERDVPLPTLLATLQVMQGYLLARAADWSKGIPLVEQGMARLGDDSNIDKGTLARGLMRLCYVPRWQGNIVAHSENLREECISVANVVDDRWCIASCLQILGNTLHWSGEGDKAIEYLKECLRLFKELDDVYRIHRPYLNLGVIANDRGNYEEARRYFAEGIRLSHASNSVVDKGFILAMSIEPHVALGDIDAALEAGYESIRIVRELGLVRLEKDRGNMLAEALRANGQLDEAEELHMIALQQAQDIGQENIIADTYRRLSRIAWARLDYVKAEEYLIESIALSRKNANNLWTAFSLRFLGLVLVEEDSNREEAASAHFHEALELALELKLASVAMDSFRGLGILLARGGQHERALEFLTFVEGHPASTDETKAKTTEHANALRESLPAARVDEIQKHVEQLDWRVLAEKVISER